MSDVNGDVPESPPTWENVAVGEVKEVVGRLLHNDELTHEGTEQKDVAHEVREEYKEQHQK